MWYVFAVFGLVYGSTRSMAFERNLKLPEFGVHEDEMPLPPWNGRAVLLVDLDAFFASVEQREHPEWRGKPVIVGGDPQKRGVVSTASYEARAYGVHSAMPSSTARKLCPEAIWTPGDHSLYKRVSNQVMDILRDETPFMQQVSIDEAFLDITPTPHQPEHPAIIARRIKDRVRELGITCSIGLATCKSVAKVASDADKPDGLTIVYPGREAAYLAPLPLSTMSGIGDVAARRLNALGLRTLGDIANADEAILQQVFGKNAQMMRERCAGSETSPVREDDTVKSVSAELSFSVSLDDRDGINRAIATMAAKVCRRLRKKGMKAHTIALKMRYEDLKIRTAQTRLEKPTDDEFEVAAQLEALVDTLWTPGMLVRLIGVATSQLEDPYSRPMQGTLFELDAPEKPTPSIDAQKRAGLIAATDKIRDRFGERAVNFGRENATWGRATGSGAKNPEDYK